MSYDLAVWVADAPVTGPEAQATYQRLAGGTASDGEPEADSLRSFRAELLRRFPAAEDLPDDQVDDAAWAAPISFSARSALLPIVRSRASEVAAAVRELAAQHGLVCYDPQDGSVRNPGAGGDPLRLEMADGSAVDQPDAATLRRLVGGLSPANWYAILERQPGQYLQAGLGRNAGVRDGQFSLEHRDGGPERHYRCVLTDRERVVEAFAGFAGGRPGWAEGLGWQRLVL